MLTTRTYTLGLSLGQVNQYTALAVVERHRRNDAAPVYAVRHLASFVPGTPYVTIIDAVRDVLTDPALTNSIVVVDHTVVGQAVFDTARHASLKTSVRGVVITGGYGQVDDTHNAPKQNLIGVMQIVLQEERFRVAASLEHTTTLADELRHFQLKTVPLANDAVLAWSERPHDDLVLATAMAVWKAERLAQVWTRVL